VTGEIVASAGAPVDLETKGTPQSVERWDDRSVTLVNPVDLGTNVVQVGEGSRPIIVMPRRELTGGTNSDRRVPPPFGWWRNNPRGTNSSDATNGSGAAPPLGPPPDRAPRDASGRPLFGRPPWMSEEEFKSLI